MPYQACKCEGCGEYDYVEYVPADNRGAFLCRYCRETLYEEGEIELVTGEVLKLTTRE